MRVILAPQARGDLDGVWAWGALSDPVAAARYVERIVTVLRLLASSPELGRRRDELVFGLRSIAVERHVVFYRLTDTSVEIVRILHGRRDVDAAFR